MTLQRTESFVPLTAAPVSGGYADHRVEVVTGTGEAREFRPLKTEVVPTSPPLPPSSSCEPRISVAREGDRVLSIRVQCSCGQVMDLACVYPDTSA